MRCGGCLLPLASVLFSSAMLVPTPLCQRVVIMTHGPASGCLQGTDRPSILWTGSAEEHARLRKSFAPFFAPDNIDTVVSQLTAEASAACSKLQAEAAADSGVAHANMIAVARSIIDNVVKQVKSFPNHVATCHCRARSTELNTVCADANMQAWFCATAVSRCGCRCSLRPRRALTWM